MEGQLTPNKIYHLLAMIYSHEDKYFVFQTPSEEVAAKIVELWNGEGK